jgi:hypothetical protein
MDLFPPTRARHHTNLHPNDLGSREQSLPKKLDGLGQGIRREGGGMSLGKKILYRRVRLKDR